MHSEYLQTPCEIAPERRQGRAEELCDLAMVLTVERCYPGVIDAALQDQPDEYDSLTIYRLIQQKYTDALLEFGFAQARGLELGLLVRSVKHCDSKAGKACAGCPLASVYESFGDRIAQLKELATEHGIAHEDFLRIYKWSAEAASTMPEARETNEATENALALLTHEC